MRAEFAGTRNPAVSDLEVSEIRVFRLVEPKTLTVALDLFQSQKNSHVHVVLYSSSLPTAPLPLFIPGSLLPWAGGFGLS